MTTPPKQELLPCPFCKIIPLSNTTLLGGKLAIHPANDCVLRQHAFSADEWNTRTPPPSIDDKEVERLVNGLLNLLPPDCSKYFPVLREQFQNAIRSVIDKSDRMGDIDYSFDFRSRYDSWCTSPENRETQCNKDVSTLKQIEDRFKQGELIQVKISDWWHDLLDVGMYDGWPYWKPTPAVFVAGTLGGEWHFWYDVKEFRVNPPAAQ